MFLERAGKGKLTEFVPDHVLRDEDRAESAAIVNAIARLGDNLSLPVTAEGVERADIENRLREIGVNKGQGWLYGHPMPISQVRRLLAERQLLPLSASGAAVRQMG